MPPCWPSIKQYGWKYAVIDEGWYMENPFGANLAEKKYLLDGNGILIPVANRFPIVGGRRGLQAAGRLGSRSRG